MPDKRLHRSVNLASCTIWFRNCMAFRQKYTWKLQLQHKCHYSVTINSTQLCHVNFVTPLIQGSPFWAVCWSSRVSKSEQLWGGQAWSKLGCWHCFIYLFISLDVSSKTGNRKRRYKYAVTIAEKSSQIKNDDINILASVQISNSNLHSVSFMKGCF